MMPIIIALKKMIDVVMIGVMEDTNIAGCRPEKSGKLKKPENGLMMDMAQHGFDCFCYRLTILLNRLDELAKTVPQCYDKPRRFYRNQ